MPVPLEETERDRERERLEKIEREERERQERLASARYDLVGAAKDRTRPPPPPYSSTATPRPSQSSSRTGDVTYAGGAGMGMGIPASNFDRDLEVARSGSPSNISARSKYSARGTVGTGSGREYALTPDPSAPQPGNRSHTPDDR